MKTPYLLAPLCGDQPAQFALLRLDESALAEIAHCRKALYHFPPATADGVASIIRAGHFAIDFLKQLPEAYDAVASDCYEAAVRIDTAVDFEEFLRQSEAQGCYCRASGTGLKIYPDSVYVIGFDAHSDYQVESHALGDQLESLLSLLPPRREFDNPARAAQAGNYATAFARETGIANESRARIAGDLIAGLLHWVERDPTWEEEEDPRLQTLDAVDRGLQYYIEEQAETPQEDPVDCHTLVRIYAFNGRESWASEEGNCYIE